MGALTPSTAIHDDAKDCWYLTTVPGVPPLDTSKAQPYALVDYDAERRRAQMLASLTTAITILGKVDAALTSIQTTQGRGKPMTLDAVLEMFAPLRTDIRNVTAQSA